MNHITSKGGQMKENICKYSKKCDACKYIEKKYKDSLFIKQKRCEELLSDFCKVERIAGMKEPYHYRNKVHHAFSRDKKGNTISGQYKESSHTIVDIDRCLIEDEYADEIISYIKSVIKSFKIKTYDEKTGYGLLRHVLIRTAHSTGQVMVVLVAASPVFPSKNNFVKALVSKFDRIKTVVLNVNDRYTSMVLGDRNINLYGKGYIEDVLCGKRFRISPSSFYQINSVQTEKLYNLAIEQAGINKSDVVIDAYSGIGTIGIIASENAGTVHCVELNKAAVRDAIINAKLNHAENIEFVCKDAGDYMVSLAQKHFKADVLIMDPPRSGSTKKFIDQISILGPERVVYVSCNPETLKRDLKYFITKKYQVIKAMPVDMFPFTEDVETCCLLSRKDVNKRSYVSLDVEMEDYYRIKNETEVTTDATE